MKRCLAALLALCTLLALCACGAAVPGTENGVFSLDILNTGKSDCIIVCMDGVTVVNDAADEDDFDAICAALDRRGVQRIDYLILSHYDKDHIGSAAALVHAYPVGQILGPDYEEESVYFTLLERAAEDRNTPFLRLTENYRIETENGSVIADPPDVDYGDDNNNSLVTTVTWRGTDFLLLGDAKKNRLNIAEYTPIQVKLAVTGYGRAEKKQVQEMVKIILGLPKVPKPDDAADALALAICHAHCGGSRIQQFYNGKKKKLV